MKTVLLIFVLCLAHLQDVHANVRVLHKSIVNQGKILVFDLESYNDERLTYALCENNEQAHEINCILMREKKPYENDSYTCDVTVRHVDMPRITVFPFGEHNVALTVFQPGNEGESKSAKFIITQMDSCRVNDIVNINFEQSLPHSDFIFIGHRDSFDVFYGNDRVSCSGKMCKATIGTDGRLANGSIPAIGKLVRSYSITRSIVSLDDGSSRRGYFYIKENGQDEYIFSLVQPDGAEKILAEHPRHLPIASLSAKNKLFGMCYHADATYHCSQYDFDGNLMLQATVPCNDENRSLMRLLDVYNLPNGGFYVLSIDCGAVNEYNLRQCKGFLIDRIDADGTRTGSMNFQGYNTTNFLPMIIGLHPLFYENETNDTCLSVSVYSNFMDESRLDLFANCFTEADFSK